MKVLLRSDGGREQGTGHLIRCLTLAEALRRRGHETVLMTAPLDVEWLRDAVAASEMRTITTDLDRLDLDEVSAERPDWVVVDSYRIPAASISEVNERMPVLAIVDGDRRGIRASLYLDQNLGSTADPSVPQLSGERFSLIRDDVIAERRSEAWRWSGERPRVVAFLGGSDPTDAGIRVAESLATCERALEVLMIAPDRQHAALEAVFAGAEGLDPAVIGSTPELPRFLGGADMVISAAGTSAWDVCSIGVPAIFIAVVDNQQVSLREAVARGVCLGVDGVAVPDFRGTLREDIRSIVDDVDLRCRLAETALTTFDGLGKERVAEQMEQIERTKKGASW